jgi:myo-inositol-1(or 4)-monophosphatase
MAALAGAILRERYGRAHDIRHKGRVDLVTEVDHLSEALIIEEIHGRFPAHQILAEESGFSAGQAEHLWYIDPLDGTVNYAHGIPVFCVSLAYAYKGRVVLGVVYDPLREEMFSAERGRGAWLNGQPVQVSDAEELIDSLLATGFPYDIRETHQNNLGLYAEFALTSQAVRRLGSAALDLCYVAAGRLEGYWELQIALWDIAAGALIAAEAGAVVTDCAGDPDYLKTPTSMLAAVPAVHPRMLAVIRPVFQM